MPNSARWAAAVVISLLLGSCRESGSAKRALPPAPPTVKVEMREYSFVYPGVVPRGRVLFVARNVGKHPHNFSLVPLPKDFPPILEQLRGSVRRTVNPLAGAGTALPGHFGAVAVDLVPGRYAFICYVVEAGVSHAAKGMASEFTVR